MGRGGPPSFAGSDEARRTITRSPRRGNPKSRAESPSRAGRLRRGMPARIGMIFSDSGPIAVDRPGRPVYHAGHAAGWTPTPIKDEPVPQLQTDPRAGIDGPTGNGPPGPVLLACPDARPPAYQAAVGLARAGRSDGSSPATTTAASARWPGSTGSTGSSGAGMSRRSPVTGSVRRWASTWPWPSRADCRRSRAALRRRVSQWRTEHFDRLVAAELRRTRPDAALIFSDVGSRHALPACRELGIASRPEHGPRRRPRGTADPGSARPDASPDFFPLYLGDGPLDRDELDWLHERRLRDIELADRILVPSEHIAGELTRHGTPAERIARRSLRGRHAAVPPRSARSGHGDRLHVPVRRRDHPAQGDQVPPAKPGGRSAGRAGGCNCSGPAARPRRRWRRYCDEVELLGRVAARRGARRGWRRPTCSSSRRCSRARPS